MTNITKLDYIALGYHSIYICPVSKSLTDTNSALFHQLVEGARRIGPRSFEKALK